jgi:hypothetical protein
MLSCISIVSLSQSSVSWKKANFAKTDNMTERIFRDADGNVYVLYYETTPFLVVKGVSLNKFSQDLKFEERIPIESATKDYLSVFVVGDMICMAELKMPSPKSKSNYAMFYNYKGELVNKIEVDAEYNIESIKLSKDEKSIIVKAINKVANPNSKLDKDYLVKAWAYNKSFEKLAEESFKFEDIFTNSFAISSLDFDISSDNKIVAMCTNEKKIKKAQLTLAAFNKTGQKPTLYNYSFTDDYTNFEYNFGKNNEIFISGTVSSNMSFKNNANSGLFFINQSLESDKAAKPVIYEMSKQIYVSYPEYKKVLAANSIDPFGIFTMSDGVLYGAMKVVVSTTYSSSSTGSSSSKTKYYSKSFIFIKFSFSGEIQWLKIINKELYTTESMAEMAYINYKQDGDVLRVVYNDNPANIINKGTKMVRASMKKCVPALAEITSSGDIKTTPLDKLGKTVYFCHPRKALITSDAIYLIESKMKTFGYPDNFIGKVPLAE